MSPQRCPPFSAPLPTPSCQALAQHPPAILSGWHGGQHFKMPQPSLGRCWARKAGGGGEGVKSVPELRFHSRQPQERRCSRRLGTRDSFAPPGCGGWACEGASWLWGCAPAGEKRGLWSHCGIIGPILGMPRRRTELQGASWGHLNDVYSGAGNTSVVGIQLLLLVLLLRSRGNLPLPAKQEPSITGCGCLEGVSWECLPEETKKQETNCERRNCLFPCLRCL